MRRVVLIVAALLATFVAPAGLAAQASAASWVDDLWQEYGAATDAYRAAFTDWEIRERDWGRLMTEYEIVSASGEDGPIQAMLAQIQDLSGQVTRAESVLRAKKEAWYAAGEALIDTIDSYLDILSDQAQRSPVGSSQDDLLALYDRWNTRLQEVEEELGQRELQEFVPIPDMDVREGDAPRDLLFKAKLLERRVEQYDRLVQDLDQDIEYLSGRQRRERGHNNFLAGLNRFDETGVPVDARSSRGDVSGAGGVSDTTAVDLARESIEARIQRQKDTRADVIERMNQAKEMAAEFRRLAGGRS